MPIPTLLTNLSGSLAGQDRSGPLTLTGTGALRYRPGPFPGTQAALVEEGTTNVVPNPRCALTTTGWTGLTRDTTWAQMGSASGLLTATGANATATISVTLTAATWTLQAVVRNNASAARTVQLTYNGAAVPVTAVLPNALTNAAAPSGAAIVSGNVSIPAGATVRFAGQVTGVTTAANAGIVVTNSASGETCNLGYFGAELRSYATTPCPEIDGSGNVTTGYSWAGTANASASTRMASFLSLATTSHVSSLTGSVLAWASVLPYAISNNYVVAAGNQFSGDFIGVSLTGTGSHVPNLTFFTGGTLGAQLTAPPSPPLGVPQAYYADWTPTTGRLAVNGGTVASIARAAQTGVMNGQLLFGSGPGPAGSLIIGPVAIFDRPLTDAERTTLFQRQIPWTMGMLQPSLGGILRVGRAQPFGLSRNVAAGPLVISGDRG